MLDAAVLDVPVGETVPALLAAGLVSKADVADAHRIADEQALTTLQVLIDNGAVSRTDAVRTAAATAGLDYVELAEYGVDASAAALLPAEFARRATVLPLGREDGVLIVAVTIRQAGNIELKDDLARLTRHRTRFVVARSADIVAKIGQVYRAEGELDDLSSGLVDADDEAEDLANFTEVSAEAPVVRFVNLLIAQAI
ncbi:MAG TPA: type II secretion system protein GspE, partial [Kribbellaceae bacterium]|nr:type II secretion system protein GspE [Kribbellaceae bacterium]